VLGDFRADSRCGRDASGVHQLALRPQQHAEIAVAPFGVIRVERDWRAGTPRSPLPDAPRAWKMFPRLLVAVRLIGDERRRLFRISAIACSPLPPAGGRRIPEKCNTSGWNPATEARESARRHLRLRRTARSCEGGIASDIASSSVKSRIVAVDCSINTLPWPRAALLELIAESRRPPTASPHAAQRRSGHRPRQELAADGGPAPCWSGWASIMRPPLSHFGAASDDQLHRVVGRS